MNVTLRPPSQERGSALLVTVVSGTLIGFMLLAYLSLVGQQNRSVLRSQSWNYAIAVAEAGLEEALTQLYHNADHLATNGWILEDNAYVKRRVLADGYYIVGISNVTPPVIYSRGAVLIPSTTNYIPPRTIRITTSRLGLFAKGMVAKGLIDLRGNNIQTDSFDSADSDHSTGGRYDETKAKDNGDIATNLALTNSLRVGNADIRGHASTGPGGSASVGPEGSVGSKAWHDAGYKGVEPGYFRDDMNISFPDVEPPFSGGTVPKGGKVGGEDYAYVLSTGNYRLNSLTLTGKEQVLVNGQAVLYVTGDIKLAGSAAIDIQSGASLKLYMAGADASLGGNGVVNLAGNATNFFYYGLPSNTSLSLSGNAEFVGVIYAPSAAFTLGGGGSSDYDFVGASVTDTVKLNGHYKFHYDESLGRLGPPLGYVVKSWDEI